MGKTSVSVEDFVGRWTSGNDRRTAVTIEIDLLDDRFVVRVIADFDGELAEIGGPNQQR